MPSACVCEGCGSGPVEQALHRPLCQPDERRVARASYHLGGLTTTECLWRPAETGPHGHRGPHDGWYGDWPGREGYDIGPPSIAWITWHIEFWWSMVRDHSFGAGTLVRAGIAWPGDADAVRNSLAALHADWRERLSRLTDADLRSAANARWPFEDRPFADVVAWANVELAKNAAEIGYVRFLYAATAGR